MCVIFNQILLNVWASASAGAGASASTSVSTSAIALETYLDQSTPGTGVHFYSWGGNVVSLMLL